MSILTKAFNLSRNILTRNTLTRNRMISYSNLKYNNKTVNTNSNIEFHKDDNKLNVNYKDVIDSSIKKNTNNTKYNLLNDKINIIEKICVNNISILKDMYIIQGVIVFNVLIFIILKY
jgi:hypothetical protein